MCGIKDNSPRKLLLREKELTLSSAIDMCHGEAATERHIKGIADDSADNPFLVNAVSKNRGDIF